MTCQISAILYADRDDRGKLLSLHRATWRFTPIAANFIASFRHRLMRTHLAIFFADRGSRRCGSFEKSCYKIAQPDGLALLAIRSNDRRKSRERANLANVGEFNRRYLTCQISAIFYADRGDRQKSQSLHRAHLAICADRGDRRIKSPSVSLALYYIGRKYFTFKPIQCAKLKV